MIGPPDYDVTVLSIISRSKWISLSCRRSLRQSARPARSGIGLTAAESQRELAKVNARPDVTLSANYFNSAGLNVALLGVSVPVPIFDRNQGEVARTQSVRVQAQQQHAAVLGQEKTEVKDAYEALQTSDRVARLRVGTRSLGRADSLPAPRTRPSLPSSPAPAPQRVAAAPAP